MSTRRKFQCLLDLFDAVDNARKYGVELPPSVENALQNIREEFDEVLKGNEIMISWSIGDIQSEYSDRYDDAVLTDDDARDILVEIERKHNPEFGINYDVIDEYIQDKG